MHAPPESPPSPASSGDGLSGEGLFSDGSSADASSEAAAAAGEAYPALPPPHPREAQAAIMRALDYDPAFNGGYTAESIEERAAVRRDGVEGRLAKLLENDDPSRYESAAREADGALEAYLREHKLTRFSAEAAAPGRGGLAPPVQICAVVDMDCFFAGCELARHPHLAGHPVGVSDLGCICTANYTARTYGVGIVGTARGRELCRRQGVELKVVKCDYAAYGECSKAVQRVMRDDFGLGPERVKVPSMDEMFVDLTALPRSFMKACVREHMPWGLPEFPADGAATADAAWGAAECFVAALRQRIYSATRLSCSAGLAPTFLAAKVCSNVNKPNGQYSCATRRGRWDPSLAQCPRDLPKRIPAPCVYTDADGGSGAADVGVDYHWHRDWFMHLPARHVSGIGPKTQDMLEGIGCTTVEALHAHRGRVAVLFPKAQAQLLLLATEAHQVVRKEPAHKQSVSQERSFGRGVPSAAEDGRARIMTRVREVCENVAADMAAEGLEGKTVALKLRLALPHTAGAKDAHVPLDKTTEAPQLRNFTRALPRWTDSCAAIHAAARELLEPHFPCVVWLVGVTVSNMRRKGGKPEEEAQRAMLAKWVTRKPDAGTSRGDGGSGGEAGPPGPRTIPSNSLGRGNSSLCQRLWKLPADDPLPESSKWASMRQVRGKRGRPVAHEPASTARATRPAAAPGAEAAIDLTGESESSDGDEDCIIVNETPPKRPRHV
eukprot:TRINITY_DN8723_c0_g1_i1.p1 TRINITY_DN8723_c0_g1~~TRINITY_DN8723_c0_g1_i1.p1  ORF type:complete len:739 (+),score=252.69 TRINITY_DN8723_c0_g1_i1:52-2217(+)